MNIDTSFWGLLVRFAHRTGYINAGVLITCYCVGVPISLWYEAVLWLSIVFSVIHEMAWFHEDEFEVVEEEE